MNNLKDILNSVQKPGRYIGEETNIVRKKFSSGKVSVVLAYPDMYEVGMSYLGIKLLYHLLNEREDVVCERVFAPWPDMEEALIKNDRKLFSLESKTDINRFDIVGFSLSYELTYTNVLNMLHLSGITVRAEDRKDEEPLVIAGGASSFNPEPMSDFIDVFFIGDAEESLPRFLEEYRHVKAGALKRRDLLKKLSTVKGVYVPVLYKGEYRGTDFLGLRPLDAAAPARIEKSAVADLDKAYYPVKQIVPLLDIVHDRIAVEIMRGCPNKCRFCEACAINRPVRIRKPETVRKLCRDTYRNTGYEQVSLLSLSSINYPGLKDLVKGVNDDLGREGVGISIPSLRVDETFYELPEMMSVIRKAGLTFAPESASPDIRKAIGKDVEFDVLCRSAEAAYKHGWRKLKLYFMVGFPGSGEDEGDRTINTAREISNMKRMLGGRAAEVKLSVNTFIPKPHTPFQWLGMRDKNGLEAIKTRLRTLSSKYVQVEFHDIRRSFLECALSRGDRRLGKIIYSAWQKGAKMDSWSDFFAYPLWEEAFRENGTDIIDLATKTYPLDIPLPWSHIATGIKPEFLKDELMASGFLTFQRT